MKSILESHPVSVLKKEISKTNIKGYSKMKKDEVVKLMLKHESRFKHIKMAEKKPVKKATKKETHKMPDGTLMTGKTHNKDSIPVKKEVKEKSTKPDKKKMDEKSLMEFDMLGDTYIYNPKDLSVIYNDRGHIMTGNRRDKLLLYIKDKDYRDYIDEIRKKQLEKSIKEADEKDNIRVKKYRASEKYKTDKGQTQSNFAAKEQSRRNIVENKLNLLLKNQSTLSKVDILKKAKQISKLQDYKLLNETQKNTVKKLIEMNKKNK